ncbi:MAG: hypothetical protein AAGI03_14110, partial [Pseudomonadota bacterium]
AALALVEEAGGSLPQTEALDLALKIERAIDTEVDGRTAQLRVPGVGVMSLSLLSSRQAQQTISLAHGPSVAPVEAGLVIEGGWLVATGPIIIRPLPDLQTQIEGGSAPTGSLFERIASVTSAYGDRWFLVGRDGIAHGYISAGYVTRIETFNGPVVRPFTPGVDLSAPTDVTAQTTCRVISVSLGDLMPKAVHVCRHADGRWLERMTRVGETRDGPAYQTGSALALLTAVNTLMQPADKALLAGRLEHLVREGAEGVNLTVPLSTEVISLEFEVWRPQQRIGTTRRTAEVAPLDPEFMVGHGWVEALRETQLRPLPSFDARFEKGTLPMGASMEILGIVGEPDTAVWALIGQNGVGQGYAPLADLRWLDADPETSVTAFSRPHGRIIQEQRTLRTACQIVRVSGFALESCNRTDGEILFSLLSVPEDPRSVQYALTP